MTENTNQSKQILKIAQEFINQAQNLAKQGRYNQAHTALDKAKEYAYQNTSLLDAINIKHQSITDARQEYIKKLEENVVNIFKAEQFDSERAKAVLDALQQIDKNNELAHILLQDLPIKQTAERERRIVAQFKHQLEKIWDDASKLEDSGAGTKAVETYQLAYDEAYKKASNHPDSIPLEQLKVEASQKRNQAREKWVGTPTLIPNKRGLTTRAKLMTKTKTNTSKFNIAQINAQPSLLSVLNRTFKCPPKVTYTVFQKTLAGPEFIDSYGPNESLKLKRGQEIYRIPIQDIPTHHVFCESYSFNDGTMIDLETELFVEVVDPVKVARLTIQDNQDLFQRLQVDIRWFFEVELNQLSYAKVFYPETMEIKLDISNYAKKIKQTIQANHYGLKITEVHVYLILPPKLKKRWETDITIKLNRDKERLDKMHQLELDRLKQLYNLWLQEEQLKREKKMAMLELKKDMIKARIAILNHLSTGEIELTKKQINQLIKLGLDPIQDQTIPKKQIGDFVELVKGYLKEGGAEKVREALEEFLTPDDTPLLSDNELIETNDVPLLLSEIEKQVTQNQVESFAVAQIKGHDPNTSLILNQPYKLLTGILNKIPDLTTSFTATKIELPKMDIVEIDVTVHAPTMEISPHWKQSIKFFQGRDSGLIEFNLIPKETGHKQIKLDFYYQQHWLTHLKLEVDVIAEETEGEK